MVSGARDAVYPSRGPVMRYPSRQGADPWPTVPVGGGGFPPRTSAHADKQDTPPLDRPALEASRPPDASPVGHLLAAGAAPGPPRVWPGGRDSPRSRNAASLASRVGGCGAASGG